VRRPDAAAGGTLPPMSPPDPADRRALPGCLVNLLAQLGAVAVLFAILLCGAGLGAASAPVTGPFGFMGGMLCFGLSAPVVGLTAGLLLRRAITKPLDRAFADLDPSPRRFMLSGRAWLGERGGRAVQAVLLKGPVVQLTVACDARTRLGVGWKNALSTGVSSAVGMTMLPLPGDRDDVAAFASEAEWARGLLTDERVVAALHRLIADDGLASVRAVNLEPDCVMLTLRRPVAAPGPAEAMGFVDDLVAIAAAVEARELPTTSVAAGWALRPETLRVRPRA
jgi:hypothetical protein